MQRSRLKPHWLVLAALIASLLTAAPAGARSAQADDPPPPSQPAAVPLGPGITYQALVRKNGAAVTGTCTFHYGLWDNLGLATQIGITGTVGSVAVVNGLATLELNGTGTVFGPDPFNGQERYLALEVKCGAETSFTPLSLLRLTAAPYALALPGLHTEPNATSPNIIGGAFSNAVTAGVVGATLVGGGNLGDENHVTDNYGVVAGGLSNRAGNSLGLLDDAELATVGGGESNSASGRLSTIAGGQDSNASGDYSFIGGGGDNDADGTSSVVAGGVFNHANGQFSVVGGGYSNTASGLTSTVPGGQDNVAAGIWSFAAGRNAFASHNGAFVWADSTTTVPFVSDRANQFKVKADGGMFISAAGTAGLTPAALEVANGGSNSVALYAKQTSADTVMVLENHGTGDIMKAFTLGGLRFRIDTAGNVMADGSFTTPAADFAEMLPAAPGLAAGDVLVIGPDGELAASSAPFQTTVAGVYSTKPAFLGGASEGLQPGDVPLAIVGVVPVCASAENGAIHPGDLLVTSATPGCAMRAGANPPLGSVIGKALQALASGQGVIKLLVTLQ